MLITDAGTVTESRTAGRRHRNPAGPSTAPPFQVRRTARDASLGFFWPRSPCSKMVMAVWLITKGFNQNDRRPITANVRVVEPGLTSAPFSVLGTWWAVLGSNQ